MGLDTNDRKIIEQGEEKLRKDPENTEVHFSLAMAYESIGEFEKALKHNGHCLEVLPEFFPSLTLTVRCLSRLERYEDAYRYAQKALNTDESPGYPDLAVKLFRLISYVPGMKSLRSLNEETIKTHEASMEWLSEYVVWYESEQSPNQQLSSDSGADAPPPAS
ncbi:MAG: hypothetical protein RPU51_07305 [Candidatus Sedimenticola sp. (ex Thyasira tokunagai)]